MRKNVKSRILPLLLLVALLAVTVTILVPMIGSAEPEPAEIQDFAYQTLSGAGVQDDDTDLRFVFTIGSLEYSEVGVIVSKSVETPTYDAANCYTHKTTVVHSSIIADGDTINAPDGRYYVAAKLTDVPHSYFDSPLYIRAFVKDGGGVRYSNVTLLTVCTALGHKHTFGSQLATSGYCAVCDLDGVSGDPAPYVYNSGNKAAGSSTYTAANGDNANDVLIKERYYNIQNASGKKFYPTQGDPMGNDLLVEYSILWNATLENWGDKGDDGNSARFSLQIGEGYSFFELTTRPNHNSGNWSNTFGDITPRNYDTVDYPDPFVNPNIGGYGWHRIGVRIHQEAAIDGAGVAYTYIVTYYIDGVRVMEIDATDFATASNKRMLFTAINDNGVLVYNDPQNAHDASVWVKATEFFKNSSGAYLGLADVYVTCGKDFVQQVSPVADPEAAVYEIMPSVEVPSTMYYEVGAHSHNVTAWEVTSAATLLAGGSRHGECTICHSDVVEATDPTIPYVFNSGNKVAGTGVEGNDVQFKYYFLNVQNASGTKFYPTVGDPEGNDLLIEFSLLWNPTLANAGNGSDSNNARFSIQVNQGWSLYELTTRANHGNANWSQTLGDISPNAGAGSSTVTYPSPAANANIGSFGWHRIGVRIHQGASKNGNNVAYTYVITYYVDGVRVMEIEKNTSTWQNFYDGYCRLYDASISNGNLVYSDPGSGRWASIKMTDFFANAIGGAYLEIADIYVTCGKSFVQNVSSVADPVARTIELGGNEYSAAFYYEIN